LLYVDEAMSGIEKPKQIIANFVDRKPGLQAGVPS
jgi:hypothetical protein